MSGLDSERVIAAAGPVGYVKILDVIENWNWSFH